MCSQWSSTHTERERELMCSQWSSTERERERCKLLMCSQWTQSVEEYSIECAVSGAAMQVANVQSVE